MTGTGDLRPLSVAEAYDAYQAAHAAMRFADDLDAARLEVARRKAQWLTAIRLDVASRPIERTPSARPHELEPVHERRDEAYLVMDTGRYVRIPAATPTPGGTPS